MNNPETHDVNSIDGLSRGERTRQAIIEAAYSLFSEQGYHATSMRQIAQRAEIALGGIYNHFSSKEEIFDEVLLEKHPYRQILPLLHSAPGETIEEFAHNAARTIMAEIGKRPDFLNLVFIELSEFKGKHAPLLYNKVFHQFVPLVKRFEGAGSELRDIPTHTILFSFMGSLIAYFLTQGLIQRGGMQPQPDDSLEHFLEVFLHGILKAEKGRGST